MSSNIDMLLTKSRPLRHADGTILNNYETIQEGLKCIDKYQKENSKPCQIDPRFVQWARESVDYVNRGAGTMVDYINATVVKQFDYGAVIDNTNRLNQKLERKGEFDPKLMSKIKGVSK